MYKWAVQVGHGFALLINSSSTSFQLPVAGATFSPLPLSLWSRLCHTWGLGQADLQILI